MDRLSKKHPLESAEFMKNFTLQESSVIATHYKAQGDSNSKSVGTVSMNVPFPRKKREAAKMPVNAKCSTEKKPSKARKSKGKKHE